MNNLSGKNFGTGGSGFIGSFVASELLKHDVTEVVIFDNFQEEATHTLGTRKKIRDAL